MSLESAGRRAMVAFVLIAISIVAGTLAGARATSASTLEATWTLGGRLNATVLAPGNEQPPAGQAGFEVISFAAAGPTANLGAYVYGGADTPASVGGPLASFVTCLATASMSASTLTLQIGNAFPYAGCAYYPTVTNTGQARMRVDLGSLAEPQGVFCGASTCKVDIVAGGLDAAQVASRCVASAGVARDATSYGLGYILDAGATLTCPLFVVLLQPASEHTTYTIVIDPPRPTTPDVASIGAATPPASTTTPPTASVAAREVTPRPPTTGSGLTLEGDATGHIDYVLWSLVGACVVTLAIALFILTFRHRGRDIEAP